MSSTPASVAAAERKDLNPSAEQLFADAIELDEADEG